MKKGILALGLVSLAASAHATNVFGVDTSAVNTDLIAVGTLMVTLALTWLGYKFVRRMIAR